MSVSQSNDTKNDLSLVESAQILQRNVAFEIPALRKHINKCQQIRDECHVRHAELEKNIHEIEKQYTQLCHDMSIKVSFQENHISLFLIRINLGGKCSKRINSTY